MLNTVSRQFDQAIAANVRESIPLALPRPLPDHTYTTPQLHENLLPMPWAPWIADVADRLQCPADYPAIAALAGAAALIGNRIRIRPKVHDDWLVVPNLWAAIVGVPGVMKTPAVSEGLLFFREIADQQREQFEKTLEDAEFDKQFNEAQRAELTKKMRSADAQQRNEIKQRYEALRVQEPKETRLWTTDVTVEKLGELLNENPSGLLLNRDELTGWFKVLDRAGHEQDRAFYLETWNGDGSFTFDRIARGKIHIKNLTLSILGTIQPAMIAPYLRGSLDGGSDDGLIQRFQALVYPDTPKTYRYVDRAPAGRDVARRSFRSLYAATAEDVGARRLTVESGGHAFLRFNGDAQEFFEGWLTGLEGELRSGTFETSALESHFAKYRSLMPTLALIFHLLDRVAGQTTEDAVALRHAEQAAAWCSYLQKHAEKLYSMAVSCEIDVAREILARIKTKHIKDDFSARDIYGNHWKKLSKPEDVKKGLDVLVDYGYLNDFLLDNIGGHGGRPTVRYALCPSLKMEVS